MKNNKILIGVLIFLILLFIIVLILFLNKPTYEVQFISDNMVIDTVKVKRNSFVTRPADPKKDGYVFVDWYLDNVVYNFDTKVTSNLKLIAFWDPLLVDEENTFLITFNTDGGSVVSPLKLEENSKIDKPADPTKEGYKFLGWYYKVGEEEKVFDFENTIVTENIVIYAKWEKIEQQVSPKSSSQNKTNTYVVTFDSNGGSKVSSQTVKENNIAKKPADPTKSGYTFVEWRLNGKAYNFNSKVTKNITLVAVWNENKPSAPSSSSKASTINVNSVTLSNNSLTLTKDDQRTLVATVNPSNATNKTVTWTSSNNNVVTVDSNGNVRAVGAGNATITATAGGKSATCSVTVEERVTYSLYWEKADGSVVEQYKVFIKNSKGQYVSGMARIYFNDSSAGYRDVSIATSGSDELFPTAVYNSERSYVLSVN